MNHVDIKIRNKKIKLLASNHSIQEIADIVDLHPSRIRQILRYENIPIQHKYHHTKQYNQNYLARVEKIKELASSYTPKEIARHIGISYSTVDNIIKKLNIPQLKRSLTYVVRDEKIINALKNNQSYSKIAKDLNISRERVRQLAIKLKVSFIRKNHSLKEYQLVIDMVLRKIYDDENLTDIFKMLPCCRSYFLRIFKRITGKTISTTIKEHQEKRIVAAYNMGSSIDQITQQYNISAVYVRQILKRNKLHMTRVNTLTQHQQIYNEYKRGVLSKRAIDRKFGVSRNMTYYIVKKFEK